MPVFEDPVDFYTINKIIQIIQLDILNSPHSLDAQT